jgi:hypothetical protein
MLFSRSVRISIGIYVVYTPVKVHYEARNSILLVPTVTIDSNQCTTYRTEKYQNDHLDKIRNGTYTAHSPVIQTPNRAKRYQVTAKIEWKHIIKHGKGHGPPSRTRNPRRHNKHIRR